jgi:hypothetical protein
MCGNDPGSGVNHDKRLIAIPDISGSIPNPQDDLPQQRIRALKRSPRGKDDVVTIGRRRRYRKAREDRAALGSRQRQIDNHIPWQLQVLLTLQGTWLSDEPKAVIIEIHDRRTAIDNTE